MHVGRQYKFVQFLGWTRWEVVWLTCWSLVATLLISLSHWDFLSVPSPILTIIGSALAIILAFKNSQCYARSNEALVLAGQVSTNSLILANRMVAVVGNPELGPAGPRLKDLFYRHFAWLTALRFFLREKRPWENRAERGNARFLAMLPAPESQSTLKDELKAYLSDAELEKVLAHRGDKEAFLLRLQYEAVTELQRQKLVSEYFLTVVTGALDELARTQGALKRIKGYPYARNFYSIAVFLVKIFVVIVPFGLFPYAQALGKSAGIEHWTIWLNVPFSVIVGWAFVSLEKVGENSSNPFEGGANDVPISAITRRIEIEMRLMLGEQTDLKPVEAKNDILF